MNYTIAVNHDQALELIQDDAFEVVKVKAELQMKLNTPRF